MIEDDRIRNKADLEKLFPGIPVFIMPEDAQALTDMLVNMKRPKPEDVDIIMREYGDGTAQGEDYGKPETD